MKNLEKIPNKSIPIMVYPRYILCCTSLSNINPFTAIIPFENDT